MRYRKILILFLSIGLSLTAVSFSASADGSGVTIREKYDFDGVISEWLEEEPDTPTGTTYKIWEHFGGFWADAEKEPFDDGIGNTFDAVDNPGELPEPPLDPTEEDDLLCWAATCANLLEYTGWGFVGGMEEGNTDNFFQYYIDHTTDYGSLTEYGVEWWFNGNLPTHTGDWAVEDVAGGNFWSSSYFWAIYTHISGSNIGVMTFLESWLKSGYPVGLGIYPITPPGGHAITCWGINYDTGAAGTPDYFKGVWVTDSDSHKHLTDPDDVLRYFEVDYEDHGTGTTLDDYWYMPNYGGGWKISSVVGLEPFPGESRPVADAGISYFADEGETVWFDASGSTDDDPLEYRWDFDNDGTWDTGWITSTMVSRSWDDDYVGTVRLEVFDGRLRDMDTTIVTINNVAPSISVFATDCDENSLSTLSVNIFDPSPLDTFTANIDWGEGPIDGPYNYGPGTTMFLKTHKYLDDNPSGTASDDYTVSVTVQDDDGGSDTESYDLLTVTNIAPVATIDSMIQPNDQFILPVVHELDFTGSYTDIGTQDTHTIHWDFGDTNTETGTLTPSHTYMAAGDYTVTLTITDDDGGIGTDTWNVIVVDALGALEDLDDYIQDLPPSVFKEKANNRLKAFDNKFNAIYKKLEDLEYQEIIDKLNIDIRTKFDGLIDGDSIDDWINDYDTQEHLCQKIDDITAYLATL